MRNNHFGKKYIFIWFMVSIFMLSSLEVSQAARPTYKAKHNQQKEQAEIILNVTLPDYTLAEEEEWVVLGCKDKSAAVFTQEGEPGLYALTYFISIPEGAKVKEIIIRPQKRQIELTKPIKPIPESVPMGSPPKPPIPDEKIYNSQEPYPKKDFDYEIAKQGNTFMLVLTLYPFKYIGNSKTLLLNEYMDVEITLETKKWQPNPKPRNAVDKQLKNRLVNPEDAFFSGGAK